MVFERVCADLEDEGYEVTPVIIPACAAQEDHIRERIFFVAYHHRYGHRDAHGLTEDTSEKGENQSDEDKRQRDRIKSGRIYQAAADTANNNSQGLQSDICTGIRESEKKNGTFQGRKHRGIFPKTESWIEAATRLCRLDDGTAGRLDTTAISKARWRKESIKTYGNAVHPKVVYEIFRAISTTNNTPIKEH